MFSTIKKQLVAALSVALLVSCLVLPASAAIPSGYWQYQTPFNEAKSSGDTENILIYGAAIEGVMIDQPLDSDKAGILYTTYEGMYTAYESKGDYENALVYLEKIIPYAEYLGYSDAIQIAERRLDMIDPMTQVYALTENIDQSPYYGQLHEPVAGAYYGRVFTETGYAPTSAETAVSVYVQFLQEDISDFDYFISDLDDGAHIFHVALNMPNENSSLAGVLTADSYIRETMEYLADFNSPVFLRIGGEMNVWDDLADPAAYKAAFIKIATIAREVAPNVALVFSPNSISEWNTEISDYYPGDQYVDWIGISDYSNQYRSAYSPSATADYAEMYYNAGIYANPVTSIRHIVEEFGDTKPIMITEGGTGYSIPSGEDLTSFASSHMQQMFCYLNMVYPQVKAIIYFDVNLSSNAYKYSLSENATLYNAYLSATAASPTLLHSLDSSSVTYVPAGAYQDDVSTISLAAYCNPVGDPTVTVSYVLDGTTVQTTSTMPYSYDLSTAALSTGTHTLKVNFTTSIGYTKTLTYSITKGIGNLVAIVEGTTPTILPQETTTPVQETTTQTTTTPGTAIPTDSDVYVNGVLQAFNAYEIAGNNYFMLRDIAAVVSGSNKQFEVTWDGDNNAISLISGQPYTWVSGELAAGDGTSKSYTSTTSAIYIDGTSAAFTAYEIAGNNYFKLRDVCAAFDIGVTWDEATSTIGIDTSISYTD